MSRIGNLPITIPAGVNVTLNGNVITVKGSKGELSRELVLDTVSVKIDGDTINVSRSDDEKKSRAMHGLVRALINNMIVGVTEGFEKELIVTGVGFKVELAGNVLKLALGYSHGIEFKIPEGIKIDVDGLNIKISGIDKQAVGQVAAQIREKRKPEPYKGKGIKYSDEHIIRKAGKSASAAA